MSSQTILVATAQLRWVGTHENKKLQQYWTDPLNVSGKGEWRDVPTVLMENRKPYKRIDGSDIVHLSVGVGGEEHY